MANVTAKAMAPARSRAGRTHRVASRKPYSISRLARLATVGAIAFSVLLPASQIAVYRQDLARHGLSPALALAAAVVVLSLWHVRYGLRDKRPPYAWLSLGLMVVVLAAGEALLGPTWTILFASLAASALIVLEPPWSLCGFAAVLLVVGLLGTGRPGQQSGYLALSVAFRAVTVFVLIWVVAAIERLNAARGALSAQAIAAERARIDDELRETLTASLANVANQAREADRLLESGTIDAAATVLERSVGDSRNTPARVRDTVASYRESATRAELRAVSRLLDLDEREAVR